MRTNALQAVILIACLAARVAHAGGDDGERSPDKSQGKRAKPEASKSARESLPPLPPPFLQLPNQKAAREEVEKSGLAPELVAKLLKGGGLKLDEIEQIAAKGVSDDTLTKYLRSVGASYQLTTKDIDRMRTAHVSDAVIDYLLTTPARRPLYLYTSPWLLHSDFHHDLHHSDFGHHFDHH